jgi:hypothetical protein
LPLEKLIAAASPAQEVECRLSFFIQYFFGYPPQAFACITNTLSSLYRELYDEAIPVFNSRTSEISEEQVLAIIHFHRRKKDSVLRDCNIFSLLHLHINKFVCHAVRSSFIFGVIAFIHYYTFVSVKI